MDILQVALVFLIILLSIFLSILGLQVFLILRDLRKDLNKLDRFIRNEVSQAHEVDRAPLVESEMVKSQSKSIVKPTGSLKRRFYKKMLR